MFNLGGRVMLASIYRKLHLTFVAIKMVWFSDSYFAVCEKPDGEVVLSLCVEEEGKRGFVLQARKAVERLANETGVR